MKRIIFSLGIILSFQVAYGQYGFSEPNSNAEGSTYKFSKIAKLDATPVESQGITGTCWSFSALSFFESELIRKGDANPDLLSEMFIVRKAYESKAEKYIRMDGKINFAEGGAFHDIPWVIKNYGIVPYDVYNGLNGNESYDHAEFFEVLILQKSLLTAIVSLCLICNAVVFTLYINSQKDKTAKGVFIATCLYALASLAVKWFL